MLTSLREIKQIGGGTVWGESDDVRKPVETPEKVFGICFISLC